MFGSRRDAALAAVAAASKAVEHARDTAPSAELQLAVDIAKSLDRQLVSRSQQSGGYQALRSLKDGAGQLGDGAAAAIESLSAANDAVTSLRLDGDPRSSAVKAIEAARRSGVDRSRLDEALRAARFR